MSLTDDDKQWIANTIGASEDRMIEKMRDMETRILTEFHKWASPFEARQRTHAAALRAVDAEYEFLSDRVKKLEGGAS